LASVESPEELSVFVFDLLGQQLIKDLLLSLQVQVQQMYPNDEGCRHGEGEGKSFEEARRFSGRISQDVGPSRGRLRHDVDEH
jgi:hypothetical protein